MKAFRRRSDKLCKVYKHRTTKRRKFGRENKSKTRTKSRGLIYKLSVHPLQTALGATAFIIGSYGLLYLLEKLGPKDPSEETKEYVDTGKISSGVASYLSTQNKNHLATQNELQMVNREKLIEELAKEIANTKHNGKATKEQIEYERKMAGNMSSMKELQKYLKNIKEYAQIEKNKRENLIKELAAVMSHEENPGPKDIREARNFTIDMNQTQIETLIENEKSAKAIN